jgi:hypothetical protein
VCCSANLSTHIPLTTSDHRRHNHSPTQPTSHHSPRTTIATIATMATLYRAAFMKFEDVVAANRDVLTVTGFTATVLWVFFSTFMHYAERNNPCNAVNCDGEGDDCDDVASQYRSIPAAMWITVLNLSGEVCSPTTICLRLRLRFESLGSRGHS